MLYHGTVGRFLDAIRSEGLRPMDRDAVHLSPDRETATRVGARRGRPVVLPVDAGAMHRDGHTFRISENGVWLVDAVPPGTPEHQRRRVPTARTDPGSYRERKRGGGPGLPVASRLRGRPLQSTSGASPTGRTITG